MDRFLLNTQLSCQMREFWLAREFSFMKSLFESHVTLVGKVLDMQMQRQNVIMSNIANVDTPKYKPLTLDFEDTLQKALGLDMNGEMTRTSKLHMPTAFDPNSFQPEWEKAVEPRVAHGEDRVNLDKEMVKMAKNTLQYNALAQVIRGNLEGIKTAIAEGAK